MKPYYEDDAVTLYQGRCEDVLPGLSLSGSVHLLTDPPYFKVKDDAWDNQWGKAAEFLDWMGEWLDLVKPHLSADASVWVFASPELTSAVESVVAGRFRVLNSVRWVKEQGWHKKADLAAARSFLSPWEGVVFAEQDVQAASPIADFIRDARIAAGMSTNDVEVALGFVESKRPDVGTRLCGRWEEGSSIPTADVFERFLELVGESRRYDDLRREYDDLRRPFNVSARDRSTDVWHFDNVAPYPGKHPCEKPSGLVTHMIETTTRPGDTIIDCFAGSGAVLDVARQLGRKAVGIEMDAHWCRQIEKRLSQQTFDFGEIA